MKEKIQNQNGIIQIPLLIGIIVASIIVGVIIVYKIAPNLELTTITTQPITTTTTLVSATDWSCGDSITFNYKGDVATYRTVESQGRCWLDRNLGASRVATVFDDSEAYGDLFQWGRADDGHQDRNSETTTNLSSLEDPGHSNFIYDVPYPYDWYDWKDSVNDDVQDLNLWQGDRGINNPCPNGWRVPTIEEWDIERLSWDSQNYNGAFNSLLKLTVAGYRDCFDASFKYVGIRGQYWSSSDFGIPATGICFHSNDALIVDAAPADGFSVRCIKD